MTRAIAVLAVAAVLAAVVGGAILAAAWTYDAAACTGVCLAAAAYVYVVAVA